MASKMMILEDDSTMCVRCANVTDAMEEEGIEHATEVGDAICSVCGKRIADLQEPSTYRYDVALQVTLTVYVEASSEAEARQIAFDGLDVEGPGITGWRCNAQDSFILA